jgi:hypothetical protein
MEEAGANIESILKNNWKCYNNINNQNNKKITWLNNKSAIFDSTKQILMINVFITV